MSRLLIIGYVWPEPQSSAAGSRIMQLLSCFHDQGWAITFASASARSPQAADLSPWANAVDVKLNCSSFDTFVAEDRKSTRLNSSHVAISYAVFCLKKKSIIDN